MTAFQWFKRSLMSSLAAASRPSERIFSVVDISPRGLLGLRRAPGPVTMVLCLDSAGSMELIAVRGHGVMTWEWHIQIG